MRGPLVKHEEAVDTMAAERYVLGELHETEREQFEEHFFSCPECAQDVRDLTTLTTAAKDWLGQSRKMEPPKQRAAARGTAAGASRWAWLRFSPGLAWAGALAAMTVVAVSTGYQAAHFRGLMRPQAVASILLRPETRGAAAEIPVEQIGAFLLLEADLPGSTGDLQWDLRPTGSDKLIDRQTAPAPAWGNSFKVLLPSSLLAPGEYTLTVGSAAAPSENPRVFKFRIGSSGR
jgi:hypothetical protein